MQSRASTPSLKREVHCTAFRVAKKPMFAEFGDDDVDRLQQHQCVCFCVPSVLSIALVFTGVFNPNPKRTCVDRGRGSDSTAPDPNEVFAKREHLSWIPNKSCHAGRVAPLAEGALWCNFFRGLVVAPWRLLRFTTRPFRDPAAIDTTSTATDDIGVLHT